MRIRWVRPDGILVKHHYAILRQRADSKFTVPGMPDLADEEHVQGQMQRACHARGNDYAAARQSQHQVSSNPLLLQANTQPQSRVLA